MICPKCGQETEKGQYCLKCGQRMTECCPVCRGRHLIGTIWCPTKHKHIKSWEEALKADIQVAEQHPARNLGNGEYIAGIVAVMSALLMSLVFYLSNYLSNEALIFLIKFLVVVFGWIVVIVIGILVWDHYYNKFKRAVCDLFYQQIISQGIGDENKDE